MGQIQSPGLKRGEPDSPGLKPRGGPGSRADAGYEDSAQLAAKRKADAYRKLKKKNFAWQPPKSAGLDAEWDAFDPGTLGGLLAK